MGRYAMLVPCALAGALACAPAGADEPPKKLTAEGRKQLERKWKEASDGGAKAREAGKYADATTALADALTAARRLYNQTEFPDGHTNLVSSLENLSDLYEDQGLYTDAEPLRKAATEMRRRLFKGDHQDVALGLNRLAVLYLYQGRYAEAEPLLKDVLEMYRRLHKGDHLNVAGSLNNLATTYSLQGKPTEAEPLLHEVLEMYKRMSNGDHRDVALCLNNLAGMYALQKRYAKAESSARAALEMQKRLFKGDNPEVARSLSMLGAVHMVQGNYAEAERHLKGAAEMLKRLHKGDHPELAHCLSNLGESYLDWGKYADAEKLFKDGLGMMRRLSKSDHPYTAYYLKSCAELYRCQGDYVRAENYFTEALEMARRLGTKFAQEKTEGEALTLLASQPTARDGLITTCLVRGGAPAPLYFQVWADKGFIARVYERRQQRARAATDPKATQALAELADVRRRRAELLLAPATSDPATLTKRREDIKGYEERIEQRAGELKELLPVIERAEKLAAATPTELQKVLPADVAVVDFLRFVRSEQDKDKPGKGGEARVARYLAFVVTKNRVAWVDLDEAAKIEPAIDAWRAAITGGKEIPPALPAKVRELVWDKVRRELPAGTKTVYVSPDAALCRLPFAALPGDEPGTVLLEDLALATVPHAPFLLDKLWPQDPLKNPPAGALVVGGVNYDAGPAPAAPARRGDPLIKPGAKLTWGALPATVGEADGVADAAARRKFTATRLDGAAATPAAVLAALPRARYAHFATHGFFADASFRSVFQLDERDYELRGGERVGKAINSPLVMTGLVLAGANDPKAPGRGIVTGESLIDLDLSGLELVVLSACETGIGDVADGQGTFGLQRAFHYAGATNVIASLWKVPDAPTAALMALFYQNLWNRNLGPMEALRQAQLELYKNPGKIPELAKGFRGKFEEVGGADSEVKSGKDGRAHPLLWAAFTLSGPGR